MQLVGESITIERTTATTATVSFFLKKDSGAAFVSVLEPRHRGLLLTRFQATQQEDGNYIVNATYEGQNEDVQNAAQGGGGNSQPNTNSNATYEWSPTFEQVEIANHPRIQDLLDKYEGTTDEGTGSVSFPKNLQGTQGGLNSSQNNTDNINPLFGVSSFLSLGGTWSEQTLERVIPPDLFESIGAVASNVPGGLPTPTNRFWLTMPPVVVQHGDFWKVTRRWMLSGLASARAVEAARDIYQDPQSNT
jgi:hypothetical protein